MANRVKYIIKLSLCASLSLNNMRVNAQIPVLQNLIDKIESFNNFSYLSVDRLKDMGADTTIAHNNELFLKVPNDKQFGYHYSIETDHKTEAFHRTDLYSGRGVTVLSIADTTFFPEKNPSAYSHSLIGGLKFIKNLYNNDPSKITVLKDTLINGAANAHFTAHMYDTLDNEEHLYSNWDYFIDKQTGLPSMVRIKGRYKFGGLINEYYDETRYFDYKLNRLNITDTNFAIPQGYKPREDKVAPALLAVGTRAPDWTLYDVNGNKVSLNQLKGRVVLLDFYFIGCQGCMLSIKPMNQIYEKYKSRDVVIVSLSERDRKDAVLAFEKQYKIKYPGLINAANVVKAYHVSAFPTFYFIDKTGKIANRFEGYDDGFEEKVTANIDRLLDK